MRWLDKYYSFRVFTKKEAWALFRLAAYGEAVGWTILIIGIILSHFLDNNVPVLLAGNFHGIFYIFYFVMVILTAPCMDWKIKKTLVATICGVPPYGSLIFEQWQARQLRKLHSRNQKAARA
jgi:integral membrane protein